MVVVALASRRSQVSVSGARGQFGVTGNGNRARPEVKRPYQAHNIQYTTGLKAAPRGLKQPTWARTKKKPAGGWRLFAYLSFRPCVLGILALECHSCSWLHVCECGLNQFLSRSWTTLLWVWSSPYFHLECFLRLARMTALRTSFSGVLSHS